MITITDNIDYFAFTLAIMATTAVILNLWLKKKWLQGSSVVLSIGAAALMLVELIVRTVQSGRIPVNSVYEFLLVFSFVLLAFSVFWLVKIKIQVIAVFKTDNPNLLFTYITNNITVAGAITGVVGRS